MIESLKARFLIISAALFLGFMYLVPNFVSLDSASWWPAKNKLVYGLDIQGGLHLVLEAGADEIIQEQLLRLKESLKEDMEKDKISIESAALSKTAPYYIELAFKSPAESEKAKELVKKRKGLSRTVQIKTARAAAGVGADQAQTSPPAASDKTAPSEAAGNFRLRLSYYETKIKEIREQAIDQSIEVIRQRIDEFGVSEPLISAQGGSRILVQLPGVKDAERAKRLIQQTAKMELAIVDEELPPEKLMPMIEKAEKQGSYFFGAAGAEEGGLSYREYVKRINQDLKGQLPENRKIVFEKASSAVSMEAGKVPYAVDMNLSIQGSLLEDAAMAFDQATNQPIVTFQFQPAGRKPFADLTGQAIGRQMAVVLDNVVKSAPSIKSKIYGSGQIELGQGNYNELSEEANMLAITLRAGALPASLRQLEEKNVGPSLGKDSIDKGKKAGMTGLLLIILFMFFYYRSMGAVANISLVLNMYFLTALLSSLSATLTLPGVAGIILTIGMAVDANVIIFERIKEELKKGASMKLAVRDGYGSAFSAILDANITTAIVCFVLAYFGSGPVRGFAVTLFCGILTSLFTAVFVSRSLFDFMILRGWKRL